MKVLIVEDDVDVLHLLERILIQHRFDVVTESSGLKAETLILENDYDIILLDIMLPGQSGMTLLKAIRGQGSTTPIILLTALGTSEQITDGLNWGADDYIVKPFKINELLARIHAVLRRCQHQASDSETYQCQGVTLDDSSKKVWVHDEEVKLTSKEFNMLKLFMKYQGKVLSREEILKNVWSINFDVGTNVVDVYVNYLRKKLKCTSNHNLIETVVGMGYVMR